MMLEKMLSEIQDSKRTGEDAIVIVRWGSQELPVWDTAIDGNGVLLLDLDGETRAGEQSPLTKRFLVALLKDAEDKSHFRISLPGSLDINKVDDCWTCCLGGVIKLDCDME